MKKRIVIFMLAFFCLLTVSCNTRETNSLIIDVLSVGKADCIVIRYNKTVVMIDTGEEENAPEILSYLNANHIQKIDCLILSHFDKDHIGSADLLLDQIQVNAVYESTFDSDRVEFQRYHSVIEEKNIALNRIDTAAKLHFADLEFVISPPKMDHYEKKQNNNASLIVSLFYKNTSFLFCGDAMEERLSEFIDENKADYDWIKIPYHGNYLSNFNEFLLNTKPEIAVICCSVKNPSEQRTLDALKENKIDIYETRSSLIQTVSDGTNIKTEYRS